MTTGTDNNGNKSIIISLRELVPTVTGVVALIGFISFWAVIPEKVSRLETHDKDQDQLIRLLQDDSAQRRELLAGALATLAQINDRTKRIEDYLLQDHPSK
jgi:hypothetical protein